MGNDFADENPYQPPTVASFAASTSSQPTNLLLLKKFRSQVHAIGAVWIIFGVFAAIGAAAISAISSSGDMAELKFVLMGVCSVFCITWMAVGILSCLKNIPAIYTGLVLSYLSLIGNLFNFNLCSVIIFGAVIIQGHRVIKMANELRQLGVSLTAKPPY